MVTHRRARRKAGDPVRPQDRCVKASRNPVLVTTV
jgi:hypothetical protein